MDRITAIEDLCEFARKGDREGLEKVLVGVPKGESWRWLLLGLTKEAATEAKNYEEDFLLKEYYPEK